MWIHINLIVERVKKLNKDYKEIFCKDIEYYSIIDDILENEKFKKTYTCRHHGLNRMEHSLKVSYYSYNIAKSLKLNYISVARAGLLHDFFIADDLSATQKKVSVFVHPYKSLKNSTDYFQLNDMEKDIIISHMFPTLPHKIPKYLESWLVSIVDKVVATYEFYYSYGRPYVYRLSNLYLFAILLRR